MLLFRAGDRLALRAGPEGARLLLLGGAAMDGPRFIFWNFVSSSRERIEQAKADWKAGRFGKVPGDEHEFIPLPEARVRGAGRHAGERGIADELRSAKIRPSHLRAAGCHGGKSYGEAQWRNINGRWRRRSRGALPVLSTPS